MKRTALVISTLILTTALSTLHARELSYHVPCYKPCYCYEPPPEEIQERARREAQDQKRWEAIREKCRDNQTADDSLQSEVLCGIFDLLTRINNQMSQKTCFCSHNCPNGQ